MIIEFSAKSLISGRETGIRTLGTREGSTVFETAPIDHSGTSPRVKCLDISNLARKRYVIVIVGLFVWGYGSPFEGIKQYPAMSLQTVY